MHRIFPSVLFTFILFASSPLFSQEPGILESEENDLKIQQFGQELQQSIYENKPETYASLMDLHTITGQLYYPEKMNQDQKDFTLGFSTGLTSSTQNFAQQIITAVENGAYYDFISYRYDTDAKTYYALFRFFSVESGINYHDYKISKVNDTLQSDDLYIYLTGEHISDTYARVYLFSMMNLNDSEKDAHNKNISDFKKLAAAIDLNNKGEYVNAFNTLEAIEGDLGTEKFVQLVKIRIASNMDLDVYVNAIEAIKIAHGQDPTIYLTLIDYHLAKEEYERAFELIDNLQTETEDDFLYYLKGNLDYQRGNYESAADYFKYVMENFPDFFQGYGGCLMALTKQDKFTEAVTLIDKLIALDYDRDALIEFIEEPDQNNKNEFNGLIASDAYKDWKSSKKN